MNKEDQLFDLMTKMYSEMKDGQKRLENRIDKIEDRIDTMEDRIDKIKNEVSKTNVSIENDIKPTIEALFDGYKQNTESINKLSSSIDDLQTDINNLTIRTLKNENSIINFSKNLKNINISDTH